MPVLVRGPDGAIVRFPDGMSPDAMHRAMSSHYGGYAQARADAAAGQQRSQGIGGRFLDQALNGATFGLMDEVGGGVNAAITAVKDLASKATHGAIPAPKYSAADAYRGFVDAKRADMADYGAKNPVGALTGQLVGGLAAPGTGSAGNWVSGAKGLPGLVARSAAVGGGVGAAYGAGDGTDPMSRIMGALQGGGAGAVFGGGVPVVGSALGRISGAATTLARNAGRAAGVVPPQQTAVRTLAHAIHNDGADMTAARDAWRGVSSPTVADLTGENTRAAIRNAGTTGPARQSLAGYEAETNQQLQPHAQILASRLTPNDVRPTSAVAADLDSRIAQASASPLAVQPGQGGATLSQALNERAAAARQQVDAAYAAARAARPDQAHLAKSALPGVAAAVHDAITDFAPSAINDVRSVLSGLDTLNAPTARDLFELRTQLGNLRVGQPTPQTVAAGRAVGALDQQIDHALTNGHFTGDPDVVSLWRQANAARRAYGQQFEGGDLIHALTDTDWSRGGRSLVVAPEDASGFILGRSPTAVGAKPNLARDFSRATDLLGPDHPAIQAVRAEAASRLLGADAGTPNYGSTYQAFERNNPALSNTVLPDLGDHIAQRQATLGQLTSQRQALDAGGTVARAPPDTYQASFGAVPFSSPEAQVGARQAITDMIGRGPAGATGALNTLGTAPNSGDNLALTFGPEVAAGFRDGLGQEVTRARNADWMAPQLGAKTFTSAQDAGHGLHLNPLAMISKVLQGPSLSDPERLAIVGEGLATTPSDALNAAIAKLHAPPFLQRLTPYAAAPVGQLTASGQ